MKARVVCAEAVGTLLPERQDGISAVAKEREPSLANGNFLDGLELKDAAIERG